MATASSPITQVSQQSHSLSSHLHAQTHPGQPQLLTKLALDLRGRRFSVDRDTIMNLPESILLCLFPNGLVLSRQNIGMGYDGSNGGSEAGEGDEEEEVYHVDFDPDCLDFVLDFFHQAQNDFYGTEDTPGLFAAQQHLSDTIPPHDYAPTAHNPLLTKQAIIVLREELEYFAIPPTAPSGTIEGKPVPLIAGQVAGPRTTDEHGYPNEYLVGIKKQCGDVLLRKQNVFTALQRNVTQENNVAEQHLIDMLCMR